MARDLSAAERQRYARHLALDEIGVGGQLALKNSRVLVIGCGGLGSPLALYLAAAGVGNLTLVDGDTVELSNLQRQILFSERQVGTAKAIAGANRLQELNGEIAVTPIAAHLDAGNGPALIADADLVVDCSDNFTTRYLINDLCRELGKPWLFAAVNTFEGSLSLFTPGTACFRCLYPVPPIVADCNSGGVLGVVPGVMGLLQAGEALKYLLGLPSRADGRLLLFDALQPTLRAIHLAPEPTCSCRTAVATPVTTARRAPDRAPSCTVSWAAWQLLAAEQDGLLVDIRSEAEHQARNVGGARLDAEQLATFIASCGPRPIGLYCRSGKRSLRLAHALRDSGFIELYSIAGGIDAHPGTVEQ